MTTFTFGLCAGRHDLPVSDFIFADGDIAFPINPTALLDIVATKLNFVNFGDKLDVYVTGLTPATVAVIKFCSIKGIKLTLKHFDRDSNSFIDDVVFDKSF